MSIERCRAKYECGDVHSELPEFKHQAMHLKRGQKWAIKVKRKIVYSFCDFLKRPDTWIEYKHKPVENSSSSKCTEHSNTRL